MAGGRPDDSDTRTSVGDGMVAMAVAFPAAVTTVDDGALISEKMGMDAREPAWNDRRSEENYMVEG